MRNKMMAIGISALMMLGLCACARSDGSTGAGAGAPAGNTSSTTVQEQNAGGDAAIGEKGQIGNDGAASLDGAAVPGEGEANGGGEADAPGGEVNGEGGEAAGPAAEVEPDATYDALNQSGDEATVLAEAGEEAWDGTFVAPSGETLTITGADEQAMNFSFAQSGISGTAYLDGDEASFAGDDGITVIFENAGGSIEVSVVNADGGTEDAAISGSFMRQ